jgi:P27 family predicted phage terminase small subunit
MKTKKLPPSHLSASSKRFWREVCANYDLEGHDRQLLSATCEAFDRAAEAREAIAREGSYYRNRHDEVKVHPGVAVVRDSHALASRLIRQLGLDVGRPDATRYDLEGSED